MTLYTHRQPTTARGAGESAALSGPRVFAWFLLLATSGLDGLIPLPFAFSAVYAAAAVLLMRRPLTSARFGLWTLLALTSVAAQALSIALNNLGLASRQELFSPVNILLSMVFLGIAASELRGHPAVFFLGLAAAFASANATAVSGRIFAASPWKYGIGVGAICISLACLAGLRAAKLQLVTSAVLVAFGALSFTIGSRSLGGFTLLTAFLVAIMNRRLSTMTRSALLGAGAVAVVVLYELAAGNGYLGTNQRLRYEYQGGGINLLLNGRPELLPSLQIMLERPLLGFGASENIPYVDQLKAVGALATHVKVPDDLLTYLVGEGFHTHSILLHQWITGGVVSITLYAGALVALAHYLSRFPSPRVHVVAYAITAFLAINACWEIIFSGWTGAAPISISAPLALITSAAEFEFRTRVGRPQWADRLQSRFGSGAGAGSVAPVAPGPADG